MDNKIIKRLLFAYIFILSLITFANIPVSTYDTPVQSEIILAVSPEGTYLEASNREARKFLEPVVQLHLMVADSNNVQVVGSATAFSVSGSKKEGISYLLGNDHFCVNAVSINEDPMKSALVTYTRGTDYVSMYFQPSGTAEILYTDSGTDMCLLKVDEYIEPVVFDKYKEINPVIPVSIVGGPDGIFPIISNSYVSGLMLRTQIPVGEMVGNGRDYLFLSDLTVPGSSGSPIFNEKGRVIGMIFATPPSMYGGIAIQGRDIRDWLDDRGVKYKAR